MTVNVHYRIQCHVSYVCFLKQLLVFLQSHHVICSLGLVLETSLIIETDSSNWTKSISHLVK